MSAFDTITNLKVKCPYCKKDLGCFQTKCFLCWNLNIPVKEYEQEMNRWNEGFYRCYVNCEYCRKNFDLEYDNDRNPKYLLQEINLDNWEYIKSFPIEIEYE